jgi:hypothetical protein
VLATLLPRYGECSPIAGWDVLRLNEFEYGNIPFGQFRAW